MPPGVNLVGTPGQTTVRTDVNFDKPFIDFAQKAFGLPPTKDPFRRQNLFLLQGNNIVSGLTFHDAYKHVYPDNTGLFGDVSPGSGALMLGGNDITISNNFFDDTYYGIASYPTTQLTEPWLGVDPQAGVYGYKNIVIARNKFGAYETSINVYGALVDSVIVSNTFWPGAWQAPIAMGFGGSRHVEISSNTIDGFNQMYSGKAADGTPYLGFRAGLFFPHLTSHEHLLVAGNKISCVGTRYGFDGEAISTDSNLDRVGFKSGQWVTSVSPSGDAVTVTPALGEMYLSIDQNKNEYIGRWVRVDYGPGLGQTRKIIGATKSGGNITFTVSPVFDVLPTTASRIIVSQQSWQAYFVDNEVDNTCSTTLADFTAGQTKLHYNNQGIIGLFGSAADTVVEANKLFKTAGIFVNTTYYTNYTIGTCTTCSAGDTVLTNYVALPNQSGASGSQVFYRLDVPAGAASVTFTTTGGGGNADLYVRAGQHPALGQCNPDGTPNPNGPLSCYDCSSQQADSNDTCTIANPVAGPYYAMLVASSSYSGVALTGNYFFYSGQTSQYFVEVRGNTIEESFGFGKVDPRLPHPKNNFGSGIDLDTQVGKRDANSNVVQTPDYMGFGVTIAHNTLKHAAFADPSSGPTQQGSTLVSAIGIGTGGALPGESPTPGFVDTLVFGNTIFDLPAIVTPPLPKEAYAILNGVLNPNYPLGTVICDNRVGLNVDVIGDKWPAGGSSTLTVCNPGFPEKAEK